MQNVFRDCTEIHNSCYMDPMWKRKAGEAGARLQRELYTLHRHSKCGGEL